MGATKRRTFREMARAAGLREKGMYPLREVSIATGVAVSTLNEEVSAGRLETFLPRGRMRGRLVRPECVDEWIEDGEGRA